MMHAYSEYYIENAQRVLAQMMHFAVYDVGMEYDHCALLFVRSGVAEQFERGNPRYVAGMSGPELADEVFRRVKGGGCDVEAKPYFDRSDAYWTGFTLAWYQWAENCTFRRLFSEVPCSSVAGMYRKYHEMDLLHSRDEINRLRRLRAYEEGTALKHRREMARMSQRELAEASGVPVRTIQQYEQRQKNIHRAAFETVESLARALYCRPEQCI